MANPPFNVDRVDKDRLAKAIGSTEFIVLRSKTVCPVHAGEDNDEDADADAADDGRGGGGRGFAQPSRMEEYHRSW
jgi:hypothetical protein